MRQRRVATSHVADKSNEIGYTEYFLLAAIYILVAIVFTKLYFASTMEWRQAPIDRLVGFSADVPFQYRVLVPFIIKVLHLATSLPLFLLWQATTVLSILGILVSFRLFLMNFFPNRTASIGALAILYPMYWNYCVYGLWRIPTDFAAIMLFLFGLHFLLARRWIFFYLIFLLGTFNRETVIFLLFALPIDLDWKSDRKQILLHVLLMSIVWIGVKLLLMALFAGNEGTLAQIQVRTNLKNLVGLKTTVQMLFSFGAIWLLIPFGWKRHPRSLRKLLWVAVPFYGVMMIVANLHELRVFGELVPIVTGLALSGMLSVWANTKRMTGLTGSQLR